MMKQDIKNNDLRERQDYVPASVKVIETSVQRVLCDSGNFGSGIDDFTKRGDDTDNWN